MHQHDCERSRLQVRYAFIPLTAAPLPDADGASPPDSGSGTYNAEAEACVLSNDKPSDCNSNGLKWFDCVDLSYDDCEGSPLQSILQCQSNAWGHCDTKKDCDEAGECLGARSSEVCAALWRWRTPPCTACFARSRSPPSNTALSVAQASRTCGPKRGRSRTLYV